MMKKLMTIALALCAVIVALACGSNDPEVDGTTGATEQTGGDGEGTAKGKMLVVYFSRAGENWQVGVVERGNTAIMVDYIKDLADVDVFEIVPETAYPQGYEDTKTVATAEFNNGTRPAIKNDITNIADYETIFIGGPIWWARPPMIFHTFFEKHPELDGKTIIPFGTHGGSSVGSYKTLIQEYYPNATIFESLGINGASIRDAASKTTVENWLKRLGVDKQSTGVKSAKTRTTNNGRKYALNGQPANGQSSFYIQNNKKYLNR
ncbi:MAG: hypothetical protein IJQ76_00020 [Prevotella sp.]|nr:hypothetical protein [Prevotella sp.]